MVRFVSLLSRPVEIDGKHIAWKDFIADPAHADNLHNLVLSFYSEILEARRGIGGPDLRFDAEGKPKLDYMDYLWKEYQRKIKTGPVGHLDALERTLNNNPDASFQSPVKKRLDDLLMMRVVFARYAPSAEEQIPFKGLIDTTTAELTDELKWIYEALGQSNPDQRATFLAKSYRDYLSDRLYTDFGFDDPKMRSDPTRRPSPPQSGR